MRTAVLVGHDLPCDAAGWRILINSQGTVGMALGALDNYRANFPEHTEACRLTVVRLPRRMVYDRFRHRVERIPEFWLHRGRVERYRRGKEEFREVGGVEGRGNW